MAKIDKEGRMKLIFFFSMFLIFLYGCAASDLPPEPKSINAPIGKAAAIYEGYGVPYDVFNGNMPIFYLSDNVYSVAPEKEAFVMDLKAVQEGGYIYKFGYYYTKGGWNKYKFQENTVSGSNWIKDSGSTSLIVYTDDITSGENYIVAYSCKKYEGQWKCGCSTKDGPCSQWMLQSYLFNNLELPPEPAPPGEIIDTNVYLTPANGIFKESDNVYIGAYTESTKDLSSQLANTVFLITRPDGSQEKITPDYRGENYCYTCDNEFCSGKNFNCYMTFSANYAPPLYEGVYTISLYPAPASSTVTGGQFTVNDQIFSEYLIEESIGNYKFGSSSGSTYGTSAFFTAYYIKGDYDTKFASAYANVEKNEFAVNNLKNIIRTSPNTVKIEINGNIVYKVSFPNYQEGPYSYESYVWVSGNNKLISLNIDGNDIDDSNVIVEAYLKKHPSDNIVVEPEHYPDILIESDISGYRYVRSNSYTDYENEVGNIIIYTALYTDQNNNEYVAMVFPLTDYYMKVISAELATALQYYDLIDIDGFKVYRSKDGNMYFWFSGNTLVSIQFSLYHIIQGGASTSVSQVSYAAESAMTKSENIISQPVEILPLDPTDLVRAYLKKYQPTSLCGNNICEPGEGDTGCEPCTTNPCIAIPCKQGTCPSDCGKKCATYTQEGTAKEFCATCGNYVCEPYETCTSSSCRGGTCTSDCGGLYCPQDCENKCTDSDGGINYDVKGTCVDSSGKRPWSDSIQISSLDNKQKLEEVYCGSDNYCYSELVDCPNGYGDGACLQTQSCRIDSDCPAIMCITTPCPQYKCMDSQCILQK